MMKNDTYVGQSRPCEWPLQRPIMQMSYLKKEIHH
jgi:hypothetical protein